LELERQLERVLLSGPEQQLERQALLSGLLAQHHHRHSE
jgi:hypothetical protein